MVTYFSKRKNAKGEKPMPSLRKREVLLAEGRKSEIEVVDYIAEGGQGEVYRVRYAGGDYALKWYKRPVPSPAFYANLANNVAKGPPNQNFLWPKCLTEIAKGSFGYLMDLRPSRYRGYADFLLNRAKFRSWVVMLGAAMNVVESFRILHSRGYSYQDLNEGGFFMDPKSGGVLICDNDNVAPFGENLGVKGTPRYMAPEVVLNESPPNTHSDRFSLAVVLFRLFYVDHPLEGRYTITFPLTDGIGARLFGERPLFVYDLNDDRNRPDPAAQPNVIYRWALYPPDLAAAFTIAFTNGLKNIDARLTETQWMEVLVKVRGMLVRLNGREQFVNAYAPDDLPSGCYALETPNYTVALGPDTNLYLCHTDKRSVDHESVSGTVKESRMSKERLALFNKSGQIWRIRELEGAEHTIEPEGYAQVERGLTIDFGNAVGRVR
jgi:DNA-binding helix-hairpin-helix protein with protein kinase domain